MMNTLGQYLVLTSLAYVVWLPTLALVWLLMMVWLLDLWFGYNVGLTDAHWV